MTSPEPAEFLLVKRGLYYRPGNAGYTGIRDNAGRYPASCASPADGVTAIHESEAPVFATACFHDLATAHFAETVKRLAGDIPELVEAANGLAALLAGFPDGKGLNR